MAAKKSSKGRASGSKKKSGKSSSSKTGMKLFSWF